MLKNVSQSLIVFFVIIQASCNDKDVDQQKKDPISLNWSKLYGGSNVDEGNAVIETADGSYVFIGTTDSKDRDVVGAQNFGEYWLVKTDTSGKIIWQTTLGGTGHEYGYDVVATSDGGFLVCGSSTTYGGSWVLKVDGTGKRIWDRIIVSGGGSAEQVLEATDGNYLVAGWQFGVPQSWGWVEKIDPQGNKIWRSNGYLGPAYGITLVPGGGYLVTGYEYDSWSSSGQAPHNGYAARLDENGNILWSKEFGGSSSERLTTAVAHSDGSFTVAGLGSSTNADLTGNHGSADFWLLKLDASGNKLWHKCLGGSQSDFAASLIGVADGFILAGNTRSNDGDVSGNNGDIDAWICKVDAGGNLLWQKSMGGTGEDAARSIVQLGDGSYLVCGYSSKEPSNGLRNQFSDVWLFKFGEKK